MKLLRGAVLLTAVATLAAVVPSDAASSRPYPRPGHTELVSVGTDGGQAFVLVGTDGPLPPAMTPDGRFVAFTSASDLAPGAPAVATDEVYLRDRQTRTTRLVSASKAAGHVVSCTTAKQPAISANGRYVAFEGRCLLPGDTKLPATFSDVYVRDLRRGTLERVNVSSSGEIAQPLSSSTEPSISADGHTIAFTSSATNLGGKPQCFGSPYVSCLGPVQVYVRDLTAQKTRFVSVTNGGVSANGTSMDPAISPDGRYVAFSSTADNLVGNDHNLCPTMGEDPSCSDIYLRDLVRNRTELISVGLNGQTGLQRSGYLGMSMPSVSAGGRYVAFRSEAAGLVPSSRVLYTGIYVRDRRAKRTSLVTVDSTGTPIGVGDEDWAISRGGRYIVYGGVGRGLAPCAAGDPNFVGIHDTLTGASEAVDAMDYRGRPESCTRSGYSALAVVSADGRYVAFDSTASDLVAHDANNKGDIFVRDRGRVLGVGTLAGAGRVAVAGLPGFASSGVVTVADPTADVASLLSARGLDLVGASLVSRPALHDLFLRVQVARMPLFDLADPSVVYTAEFSCNGARYQVRVGKTGPVASFGLYRRAGAAWTYVEDLRGGYGTTGQEVVVSIPLVSIGGTYGARLAAVTASAGIGTYLTGVADVVDRIRLAEEAR